MLLDNFSTVLNYLYTRLPMFTRIGAAALKNDLNNTIALCEALGNPQNAFPCIHIAGTNGKGSTSSMLAAIFQQAGYKTGLYTSPHLKSFTERIRINGEQMSEQAVVDFVNENRTLIEKIEPSFFEVTVGMAFNYFAKEKVDIAIIEVGLGGRLDSTNIITPELSIITNISYDHTDLLGDTLAEIAGEKAGIIKTHIPVIIGEKHPETTPVFLQKAKEMAAPIYFAEDYFSLKNIKSTLWKQEFEVLRMPFEKFNAPVELEDVSTPLNDLVDSVHRTPDSFIELSRRERQEGDVSTPLNDPVELEDVSTPLNDLVDSVHRTPDSFPERSRRERQEGDVSTPLNDLVELEDVSTPLNDLVDSVHRTPDSFPERSRRERQEGDVSTPLNDPVELEDVSTPLNDLVDSVHRTPNSFPERSRRERQEGDVSTPLNNPVDWGQITLDLTGKYQAHNLKTVLLATEILATKGWNLTQEGAKSALSQVKKITGLQGRMMILQEKPLVICDVGHNEAGIRFVIEQLQEISEGKQLHLVWGMVKDKNHNKVLSLLPQEANYYFVCPDLPRGLPAQEMKNLAAEWKLLGNTYQSVKKGLEAALLIANENDIIFVGGSTFVVAEVI